MIILFEGPDGSGKSTAINDVLNLLRKDGCEVSVPKVEDIIPTKPTSPGRLNEKELFSRLEKLAADKTIFLIDRGPFSDCVYRLFDSYEGVTTFNNLLNFVKKISTRFFTVYCRTHKAEEYMLKRGETNPTSLNRHKELTKVYDMLMEVWFDKVKFNCHKYDFIRRKALKELMDKINYFVYMNGGK